MDPVTEESINGFRKIVKPGHVCMVDGKVYTILKVGENHCICIAKENGKEEEFQMAEIIQGYTNN